MGSSKRGPQAGEAGRAYLQLRRGFLRKEVLLLRLLLPGCRRRYVAPAAAASQGNGLQQQRIAGIPAGTGRLGMHG